ncbi:Uncharacterised protein [Mycobacteroides abscessus subsp. abscessus]|nr:Uncharacterised protein [Mycobacteroides abscessus subsp. abscessus]SID11633.1 Uncharacterised protein [Mycobacteroides abscessus subsp. abscessus]SIE18446.1 Uncharacterised protein [Mycobacteroides abscessus subsp. abscessus]SIH46775.1 Uncharacterised protein [Mycobacteroides abscessus subsp. abscessus]SKK57945.1 Uncharacterised protein [Mycobacteroides abscessus subsp. abscessus]
MSDDDPYVVITDYGEATVEPPPWLATVPPLNAERLPGTPGFRRAKKNQGLPGLAQSYPGTTAVDTTRARLLGEQRRCALCGCALRLAYTVHGPQPRTHVEDGGRIYVAGTPGPSHRSCTYYAAIMCPYLRYPDAVGRAVGSRRVPEAYIVGFLNYETFTDERQPAHDAMRGGVPDVRFRYRDPIELTPYVRGTDLIPEYEQAIALDANIIDVSTRLWWSRDDEPYLASQTTGETHIRSLGSAAARYRIKQCPMIGRSQ